MDGAVGPGRELQLPHAVGEPAFERRVPFRFVVADKEGAGDADRHRVEAPAAGLDRRLEDGDDLATSAGWAYWPSSRLKPFSATWRTERSLPAPIQIGGCGFCAVGGSTTTSSNAQYLPRCENVLVRGPGFDDHVEAFVKARVGLVHSTQKPGELVVAVAVADAEIEPAAGQQVERRRLLGQQHRIVPGQHDDRGAEPQGRVRAPSQVSRLRVAETWPKPVK